MSTQKTSQLYTDPVRPGKVPMVQWVEFRRKFFDKSEPYQYLRLGQAFINNVAPPGTIDPELFYMTDVKKAEAFILRHYVIGCD